MNNVVSLWAPVGDKFTFYDSLSFSESSIDLIDVFNDYENQNYYPFKEVLLLDENTEGFLILDENHNIVERLDNISKKYIRNNNVLETIEEESNYNGDVQEIEIVLPTIKVERA